MEKAEKNFSQFPWTEVTLTPSSVSVWIQNSKNSINRNSNKVAFISLETQYWEGMVALKSLGAQTPSSPLFHYSLPLALSLMVQDGCYSSTHYHFVGKGVSLRNTIPCFYAQLTDQNFSHMEGLEGRLGNAGALARCIMPTQKLIKIPVIKVLRYSANY